MPDLFISSYSRCMDPADPCGNLSWSSELYVSSVPLLEWFLVALSHGTLLFSDVWFTAAPYLEMFFGVKQNPRYMW